ncbi:hypothetical protein B0I37DRAFT_411462 [Chaetomium sp. MPI-CAGE-AT-0009]|nr:hypothetical protein B0I37DRAFT_411462 [Chaetomium sp. MPI-CAGE-AT-0009]
MSDNKTTNPTNPDPQPSQTPFGPPNRYVTTHDPATRQSVFTTALPSPVPGFAMPGIPGLSIFDAYKTLTSPVSLNNEADLTALQSPSQPPPPNTTTIPNPTTPPSSGGDSPIWFPSPTQTLLRYCDWAPGASAPLHRTETLDLGVVVAGRMEVRLDSGEARVLNVGDTIVQRSTMHGWRNASDTEWARMVVFLVGVEGVPRKFGSVRFHSELATEITA